MSITNSKVISMFLGICYSRAPLLGTKISLGFPVAALTSYHKRGGLKQQKFTQKSEVSITGVQTRDVARALLALEALGESNFLVSSSF